MNKELIRLTNIEVGSYFKINNVIYQKTSATPSYKGNALRLDNGKMFYLNGNTLVEKV